MANEITIKNIQEYVMKITNETLILTKINPCITEQELFEKDLRGSSIMECKICDHIHNVKKYKKLLIYLYSNTDMKTILQNTVLNIKQQELHNKGFEYYPNLGVSIQGTDSKKTLKEIINIIKIKKNTIELKIKLKNNEILTIFV